MASSVNFAQLVKLAKQGMGHSEAARELGVTVGQISSLVFSKALVEAGQYDEVAKVTPSVVVRLKDDEGNRWELIAARTGKTVTEIKDLYVEGGGDLNGGSRASAGSGRGSGRMSGSKTKTAPAAKSGSKKKTAGRKAKASSARPVGRARTLAERRRSRSSNPS
jgi:hypothetical protein